MIKVLHVISKIHQGSGIANVVMNYYRSIDRSAIQFDFLVTSTEDGDKYVAEIKKYGGNIFYLPPLKLTNINYFMKEMDRFFYENKSEYSAVHSHFFQIDGLLFKAAKKYGVKECISHSHNTRYSDYKIRAVRNYLMSIPLKKSSTTWMACSKAAGEFLYGKEFYNSSKAKVLNNALDCKKFVFNEEIRENKQKELGLENKFVVGHVGRLSPQKNHEFLINVFKEIKAIEINAILILVGTGDLMETIRKQVKQYNLENDVLFLGQRSDISELLQSFDIMIFPSHYEGLGVALIEAQVSGLPCVYSDVIPEEVNILNSNIILSLDEEYKIWANAALKFLNYERNKRAGEEIEKAGFNIVIEAQKLLEFYRSLAKNT